MSASPASPKTAKTKKAEKAEKARQADQKEERLRRTSLGLAAARLRMEGRVALAATEAQIARAEQAAEDFGHRFDLQGAILQVNPGTLLEAYHKGKEELQKRASARASFVF